MYGKYKEIILENLKNFYNSDQKKFDDVLGKYTSMLKENSTIKSFDDIYSLIENSQFDDQFYAKEFLDECINYLKQLDKKSLKQMKSLTENLDKSTSKNEIRENIDNIVFSKNIEKRTNSKIKLINHLTGEEQAGKINEELQPIFDTIIEHRLNRTLGQLNEREMKVVKSYINDDKDTLKEEYGKLIEETKQTLNEKEKEYSDKEKLNIISESKKALDQMKDKEPTEEDIEKLINLNE